MSTWVVGCERGGRRELVGKEGKGGEYLGGGC